MWVFYRELPIGVSQDSYDLFTASICMIVACSFWYFFTRKACE